MGDVNSRDPPSKELHALVPFNPFSESYYFPCLCCINLLVSSIVENYWVERQVYVHTFF